MGDLFDSPWKILIIAVVVLVLFGSKKLPHAARSLGQSMRILKKEVSGLHEDDSEPRASAQPVVQAPAELTAAAAPHDQQSQIDALQQQIRDLQRATAMDDVPKAPAEASARTQQSS